MFRKDTIGEGILLLSEYIPYVHSVSLGIWVKSGSIYDDERAKGSAHFVEHMLFKGTKKRSAFDIAKHIDDVGGNLNAYTSKEYTSYYVKVLKEDLPLAIDVLSDIFLNSTFPEEEIEKEKGVVIQEIKMTEDTPDDYIHELALGAMWDGHPLGQSILGEVDTVTSLDRDLLMRYKDTHHTRENIIIGIVGNFDFEQLRSLLSASIIGIPQGEAREMSPATFHPGTLVVEKDTEQVHVSLNFPSLFYSHPKRYIQYILNTIIGGGMSSRLFQEVREKRGLAYSVYSYILSFRNAGGLGIYAGTERESLNELVEIIVEELNKISRFRLSEEELKSTKGQIKGNLILSMESTGARLSRMVKNEIYFGRQIEAEEIIKNIDAVTIDEVLEIAREIVHLDTICAVYLGPLSEREAPRIAAS